MFRIIIVTLIFSCAAFTQAQDLDDIADIIKPPDIDTAYVELNDNLWTIRLFSNIKYQSFSLKNDNGRVFYRPTDPVSGGIGGTYKTLLLDLGVRFTGKGSQRFDLQTSLLVESYFINFAIQNYEGFEETDPDAFNNFREDIRTFTMNLDVMKLPEHKKLSFRSMQSGIDRQKKSSGSLLYGAFIGYHKLRADSSIVPDYAENIISQEYALTSNTVRNIGVLGGYVHIHPVSKVMFLAGSLRPGFGIQWGEYRTADDRSLLPGLLFTKVSLAIGTGFNWSKFYASAVYNVEANYVNMRDNHVYNYNTGKLKAVIGYKL